MSVYALYYQYKLVRAFGCLRNRQVKEFMDGGSNMEGGSRCFDLLLAIQNSQAYSSLVMVG